MFFPQIFLFLFATASMFQSTDSLNVLGSPGRSLLEAHKLYTAPSRFVTQISPDLLAASTGKSPAAFLAGFLAVPQGELVVQDEQNDSFLRHVDVRHVIQGLRVINQSARLSYLVKTGELISFSYNFKVGLTETAINSKGHYTRADCAQALGNEALVERIERHVSAGPYRVLEGGREEVLVNTGEGVVAKAYLVALGHEQQAAGQGEDEVEEHGADDAVMKVAADECKGDIVYVENYVSN